MNRTFKALILIVLTLWTGNLAAQTECDKVQLSLRTLNATCASNGSFKVTVSGESVNNNKIDLSSLQFKVDGTVNWGWTHYANDSIVGLPAGTYTISMRAFCYDNNDWFVAS
ncbi:MAG: hypothetical protein LBR18_01240, partial [Tannerella sp.]|nr:hypothetical protein [Tannerella sp.]